MTGDQGLYGLSSDAHLSLNETETDVYGFRILTGELKGLRSVTMPRYVTVMPHLPVAALAHRDRHAHDPVERGQWQIVWLVTQSHRIPEVVSGVGYTANWMREIDRRYTSAGLAGLADHCQHNRGQPPL